jgi:hypothetical protein
MIFTNGSELLNFNTRISNDLVWKYLEVLKWIGTHY